MIWFVSIKNEKEIYWELGLCVSVKNKKGTCLELGLCAREEVGVRYNLVCVHEEVRLEV